MYKLFSLRKSIPSSLQLSEFSLNLLSLDHRRTSCTVSWSTEAPNLGTISDTVVSSAIHAVKRAIILFTQHPHYLLCFSIIACSVYLQWYDRKGNDAKNPASVTAQKIATSGPVQYRKSAIHGLPVTLRMLWVKYDKSNWFWCQSIVFTKPFKTGMSLDRARGRDSWCWPKGARPLGTRMRKNRKNPVTCNACVVARKIETNCFSRNVPISNDPVVRISRWPNTVFYS